MQCPKTLITSHPRIKQGYFRKLNLEKKIKKQKLLTKFGAACFWILLMHADQIQILFLKSYKYPSISTVSPPLPLLSTSQISCSEQKMDNKMCYFHFLISILLLSIFNTSSLAAPPSYNVVSFGAKPDGRTDSTKAFLSAWANACGSPRAATIYVPPGRFFLRNVAFQGPCKNNRITIRIDGTLVAPSDYRVIGNAGNWLFFQHVDGVTLNSGILDGQGTALWACKNSGKNCPSGATVWWNDQFVLQSSN